MFHLYQHLYVRVNVRNHSITIDETEGKRTREDNEVRLRI